MIKMKKLMEGFSYNRKFGEPLPTLKDFSKKEITEKKNLVVLISIKLRD